MVAIVLILDEFIYIYSLSTVALTYLNYLTPGELLLDSFY